VTVRPEWSRSERSPLGTGSSRSFSLCLVARKRMGEDSNPRTPFDVSGFQDSCIQTTQDAANIVPNGVKSTSMVRLSNVGLTPDSRSGILSSLTGLPYADLADPAGGQDRKSRGAFDRPCQLESQVDEADAFRRTCGGDPGKSPNCLSIHRRGATRYTEPSLPCRLMPPSLVISAIRVRDPCRFVMSA
jgi:hypothetical protein